MPCFLKMPALLPRWAIEVSQLARWPIVSLTRSSAQAGRAVASASAMASAKPANLLMMSSRCFIVLTLPDRTEPAEAADQRIGADRHHEQDDQPRIHPRHVEQAVGLDDQEADAAVGELGLGEQRADNGD